MRVFFVFVIAGLLLIIPWAVSASVVINEIAWMGGTASANDEWIELYNDGTETVSLVGWKILADDGTPSISLVGEIPAQGSYIMERTDDDSAPGVSADKIYTGDLANVGETLKLLDKDLVVIDTVTGGSNWGSVGGNNTTKDTPQRQSGGTWITGAPTPKMVNTTTSTDTGTVAGTSTSATTTTTNTATNKKSVVTGGYKQVVFAYAGEDVTTIAGSDTLFEGYAVSDKNVRLTAPQYVWSFGDGSNGKGKEEFHTYDEPGTYIAVLRVRGDYQQHKDKLMVTVLPANVFVKSVEVGSRGYIEIENRSTVDVDISRWKLFVEYARGSQRRGVFTMPDDTVIMALGSVKFSNRITSLNAGKDDTVALQFPSGVSVSHVEPQKESPAYADGSL